MEPDERALTERIQSGEAEAFDEVVRRYHGAVFRLARRLLRNDHDAQEVAQETFLGAFQGRAAFAGRATIRSWLLSITYNKAVDRLKQPGGGHLRILDDLGPLENWQKSGTVQGITDLPDNPEQNFNREALLEGLHAALANVPADAKAVYELADVQGLTAREVAETLGISEGAARVRLHRVRRHLVEKLRGFRPNLES